MADYRIFFLDPRGHIGARDEFEAANDDEAIARAREVFAARQHFQGFELWQRARMVTREER